MSSHAPERQQLTRFESPQVVLELTVNNHLGVMSHICGLFARQDVVGVQRHGADHEVFVRLEEFFQA